MKKFLTFFAMMFALLGFTTPVSAADYNLYVDISAKGWSDVFPKVRWVDGNNNGWYVPGDDNSFKKENLGNGLYKLSFTENKFDALIISNNDNASDLTLGANNIGWFQTGNTGDFKYENGALYTLLAGNENLVTKGTYSEPPYIYIDSACEPFEKDGSNWVYTIDATSGDKEFRIQNKYDVSATPGEKIQFGCEGGMTIDATATKSIKLYGSGNHKWTAKKGAQYVLEIPTSTAIPTEYNKSINLKITKKSVSQPPYILMKGASGCEQFVSSTDGSRWEYKIENAAQGAEFRLQIKNYTGEGQSNTVLYGSTTSIGKTTSSMELWLYGNSGGYFTINDAGTYVISFDKTENLASTNPNGPHTLYVVFTETKPATPVLPEATNNVIFIPEVSGAQLYYTETTSGDPDLTWIPYDAIKGIALTKGYTTIRAAAYKEELGDKAWSDVSVAKTYVYDLPEVKIDIDVHTGFATLTPVSALPADANAKILYSCGPAAPSKVYSAPVDMAAECTVEGTTRYPIKAIVRAWGNDDGTPVSGQSVDSEVRDAQWVGPAAVRRICLWSYGEDGNPVKLDEFSKQADGSYKLSYSPVSGTDSSKANQRYFIRVVMNHDEPNDVASDTGGTFYSLSADANGVVTVVSGVESTGYHNFTPSASDVRGMFFAGTDRDLVNLTLKGVMQDYTISGTSTECSRFVPTSMTPEWNPEASIKSVELRDANNNLLCTLTQNTGTGETNYWTGITTVALPKAADNSKDEKFHFVAETKDGTKYYSLGTDSNYWLSYGRYDETTSPKPSTSSSSGYYFCVKETSAIAQVAIAFDGTTASKISISPYTDTKKMDISGDPQAPAIYGYGSEVGSWDNAREFNQSPTLDGWVYTFIATQSTGEFLIRGSKNHLYAPIGLGFDSPTNVWRQVPDSYTDAASKKRAAAKISGLQVGARYRFILQDVGGQVQVSIEALPESVKKIKSVELVKEDGSTVLTLDAEAAPSTTEVAYSGYPLSWQGTNVSDKYRIKVSMGYDDDPGVTVGYVAWAKNDNYYLKSENQQNNKPYNYKGSEEGYFRIEPNGEYYVQVILSTSDGQATWLAVGTERQDVDDQTPYVNRVAWSLSDDNILAPGDTKYFYMSPTQNDNRLSPEWELVKDEATGKYVLDNFVVIPNAQFIVRGVSKSQSGQLTVQDWGWDDSNLCQIYASQFGITDGGTIADDAKLEKQYELKHINTPGRGYAWNLGASMVRLEFDPSVTGAENLKVSVDFSYPSTLAGAPKPGFPWVGLTSSNIVARVGRGQSYDFASNLGTLSQGGVPDMGISDDVLTTIGMERETVNSAFTNAFIQWTPDGDKVYIYDTNVTNTDTNGKNIYYITDGGNLKTTVQPAAGQVMSSTILPPRVAPQFKQYTSQGITSPSASSLTFKYHGVEKHKFSQGGNDTKEIDFAVYTISNVELQGLYKVFTGYGARRYGNDINGLTYFPNWGVSTGAGYENEAITESRTMPMNGGGQIMFKDASGNVVAKGGYTDTFVSGWSPEGNYNASHDNAAGKYFRFDNRRYVATMTFYLALDDDTNGSHKFHNSMDGQLHSTYNDGRNYSWIQFDLAAERPIITLNKRDATTARARWSINRDHNEGRPQIVSYKTELFRVDPDKWVYPANEDLDPEIVEGSILEANVRAASYTTPDNPTWIDPEIRDLTGLSDGTYVARIFDVVYLTEEGYNVKGNDHWNYSEPVTFFSVKSGVIRAEQRVTLSKDGHKIYNPIVRVYPDITNTFKSLPSGYDRSKITATVTVSNIGPDTHFQDASGNALPVSTSLDMVPVEKQAYVVFTTPYKSAANNGGKEQEGVAVVVYPEGYLGATRENLQNFDVCDSHINELTALKLEVNVPDADSHAEAATAEAMTYMPAGRLSGRLEAAGLKEGRDFNYLVVSTPEDLIDAGVNDGYARIYYADKNYSDQICYIGNVEHTKVHAQVYYVSKDADGNEVEIPLFAEDALLDMKANPDDENVYTAKRLKIGGIPYVTESAADNEMATDIDGKELKLRQTQTASFRVVLTYTPYNDEAAADADRWAPFVSRKLPTDLTYDAELLTSPRQGLRDVLTQEDADNRKVEGSGVAKDVTAVSESFIENYGGLFTNIEDAHVALHAVPKNDALVGHNSLRQWYMDHGDKFADGTVNPFNPNSHLAVGNAKADGSSYSTPDEVHPMLRSANPVASTDGFRNDSELNNAWWNHNALVKPEFHEADQIKGTLTIEGGKVTGFTPGANKPKNHRSFWAGVKVDNNEAYKQWGGGYILKAPEGFDVDIRDPKHGYYGQSNHFSKKRSGFYHGEMPLNLNDIVAVLGKGQGAGSDAFVADDRTGLYVDAQAVYNIAKEFHPYDVAITEAVNEGQSFVNVAGKKYPINWNQDYIWDYDPIYAIREQVAFEAADGAEAPADALFEAAGHMFFKVCHVNHESWFVPGANVAEGDLKTQPLWPAFKGIAGFPASGSAKEKDEFVMNQLRMNYSDYCPLAYDVRYTYPFLTSDQYVTAENYKAPETKARARKARNTEPGAIAQKLNGVTYATDVTDIVARDKGRVSFFGASEPSKVVPTAISDVNDDIRGKGFSIVYNRAAGTVTVKAEGKKLENAAVYDATGASLVAGAKADRIDENTIVLDVRNIARGAYVVGTNLGGAKFMK